MPPIIFDVNENRDKDAEAFASASLCFYGLLELQLHRELNLPR
jgi:hypothetical protein